MAAAAMGFRPDSSSMEATAEQVGEATAAEATASEALAAAATKIWIRRSLR